MFSCRLDTGAEGCKLPWMMLPHLGWAGDGRHGKASPSRRLMIKDIGEYPLPGAAISQVKCGLPPLWITMSDMCTSNASLTRPFCGMHRPASESHSDQTISSHDNGGL